MPFPKGHKFGNRFKPGQSGNPGGRPKLKRISEAYRVLLETDDPKKQRTLAELIAARIVQAALKGDLQCAREVADRTEGKAPQPVHHGTIGGEPIAVLVKVEQRKK